MRFTRVLLGLGGAVGVLAFASCSSSSTDAGTPPAGVPSTGPFGNDVAVSSTLHIDHLDGPVDVVRDTHGMVHVYATSTTDAVRAEGYQMARDRTVQLELYRRVAEGRTAELLGNLSPSLIDSDIMMRAVGLHRVAKAMYAQYPEGSELKATLDAFADGISQWNARLQTGEESLPRGAVGLPKAAFEPWTGIDALAVARLQTFNLAYTADDEVNLQRFVSAARTAFSAASADAAKAKREGLLVDLVRFAPLDPTTPLPGFPNDTSATGLIAPSVHPAAPPSARLAPSVLDATRGFTAAAADVRRLLGAPPSRGSNNWIVGPGRTATGHAMLASDPHLALGAPSTFYLVHLDVTPPGGDPAKALHASGVAFPGIPGVVLGFNGKVAWGATTADYDVTDIYAEQLTPDGSAVVYNGANVPLQKIHETIAVADGSPVEYDVLEVPHHGPLIPNIVSHAVVPPDPTKGALSIKWTGMQPTDELGAFFGFLHANSVDDARTAIRSFGVGAQNFVFADTEGNIFYSTQSKIPKRAKAAYTWDPKTFQGTIPCLVEPGDGTAEWTGDVLEEAYVPHVKNPPKGYLATANGDQVGDTLDNDPTNDVLPNGQPMYLACFHDPGYRVGRITQRIENAGHKLTLDDMASIQADAKSNIGAALTPALLDAIAHAEEERTMPGTHPDLTAVVASPRYAAASVGDVATLLTRWGKELDYDARAGVSLDDGTPSKDAQEALGGEATLVFNAWVVRMMSLVFDDELAAVNAGTPVALRPVLVRLLTADRTTLATYDADAKDSALFDDLTTPAVVESRDERAVTALLDALDYLTTKRGARGDAWRWGALHTVRFDSLIPLWSTLSIPSTSDPTFPGGFPRHGDGYNVDVGYYFDHPAKLADVDFSYDAGPVQRFVIDLDPAGPVARNVIPGGEVWDTQSPHFRDEAELWRRNQNHPIPFAKDDVKTAAESHAVFTPAEVDASAP